MQHDKYTLNWQKASVAALKKGLKIVDYGWEQHVIIDENNALVYRYPRHDAAAAKLADEVAVLEEINQHDWPIKLPVMLSHNSEYSSYKYIAGEVLTDRIVKSLSNKNFDNIGRSLGKFLALFHKLKFEIVLQKKTSHSTSLFEYYEARITGAKSGIHKTSALLALSDLKTYIGKAEPVVVHGDLHGPNVVIDSVTKELVGVIDLSEMEIGDPHQEFRKIFMTFPESLDSSLQSYYESSGQKLDKNAVILWAYANEWANLCYFAYDPTNYTYQRALSHLKKWEQL